MASIKLESRNFDNNLVAAQRNREKKMQGSYGMTAVLPMQGDVQSASRELINELSRQLNLTQVRPVNLKENGKFIDENNVDMGNNPNIIAPIRNLHTTLAAWQVMDAKDSTQWTGELMRTKLCSELTKQNVDIFNIQIANKIYGIDTSKPQAEVIRQIDDLLLDFIDNGDLNDAQSRAIKQEVTQNYNSYKAEIDSNFIKKFELEAKSIKINNDGNILIQWESSEDLKKFRKELCKNGGMAKWGPNVGTTIAYLPNWDKLSLEERQKIGNTLEGIVNNSYDLVGLKNFEKIEVNPEQLQLVSFSRNDLSDGAANWQEAVPVFSEDNRLNPEILRAQSFDTVAQKFESVKASVIEEDPEQESYYRHQ